MTALAGSLAGLRNYNVAVREWEDQVVFLHKIVAGAADKSYGIHVARLAGVPPAVVERAKQLLAQLENEQLDVEGRPKLARRGRKIKTADLQLTLFAAEEHELVKDVRRLCSTRRPRWRRWNSCGAGRRSWSDLKPEA